MRLMIVLSFIAALLGDTVFAANCDSTSKGFEPLTQMTGTYHGQIGGLYPGGLNIPPAFHDSAGKTLAQQFIPLNISGTVDSANGVWVLLSVGMSNCTQEFSQFITNLTGDTTLHPKLRVVDGAQGGQTASIIKYDTAQFWNVITNRLVSKGLRPAQVQAVWFKEANSGPTDTFPIHARKLRDDILADVRICKQKFPNLKQLFFSNRIYAGYASSTLNPEPYAYESGFSCRWVVQAQLEGNDSLNCNPDSGAVNAPWIAWGPYLWADGIIPRQGDSLQWFCSDFLPTDGTHPSTSGRIKVANLLEAFFKNSPYSKPWFLKSTDPPTYLCGDADASGAVNISDAVALVAYIFGGGPPPNPLPSGDANCDGAVNISDAVYLIAYIFGGGPAPCVTCK